jgi:hypothetical protein
MHTKKWHVILILAVSIIIFDCSVARAQGSLPSGWSNEDIGSVGATGSASFSSGVFTGAGGGVIWGNDADAFNFTYQQMSGDGTIIARIASSTNSNAQVGVMIRETLDADATSMLVMDSYGTIYIDYRTTTGSASSAWNEQSVNLPYWVKLTRSGSTFTGYMSSDGVNWAQAGSTRGALRRSRSQFRRARPRDCWWCRWPRA